MEMSEDRLRRLIDETVSETLVRIGVQASDPIEMQRDFQFMRQLRLTAVAARSKVVITVVGLLITGVVALAMMMLRKLPSS